MRKRGGGKEGKRETDPETTYGRHLRFHHCLYHLPAIEKNGGERERKRERERERKRERERERETEREREKERERSSINFLQGFCTWTLSSKI